MTQANVLAQLGSAGVSQGFKNRIINGAMVIDQRNAGASVANSAGAYYFLDRWQVATAQASKINIQQNAGSVTPPVGFSNYLGMTVTSAYTAGAADYYLFAQKIEGFNASDLGFGTANAKSVTISFQVYSSLTGTFCAALQNAAGNRTYIFNYTISSANTWTTITQTITGDTSGTWGSGNSSWGELKFDLGSGSDYQTSTVGSWAATGAFTTASAVKFVANASATFYITGVQLEVGSVATGFERRPYGTELSLCQRYYEVYYMSDYSLSGQCENTSRCTAVLYFTVQKRDAPSITLPSAGNTEGTIAFTGSSMSYPATIGTHSASSITVSKANINGNDYTSAFTAGNAVFLYGNSSPTIKISAEL